MISLNIVETITEEFLLLLWLVCTIISNIRQKNVECTIYLEKNIRSKYHKPHQMNTFDSKRKSQNKMLNTQVTLQDLRMEDGENAKLNGIKEKKNKLGKAAIQMD